MSYLFSQRGYREMIWRWRSVPFQPFFFFAPQGERKWQCGTREGRAEYQMFSRKLPGSHGPDMEQHVSALGAHVQKSGGSLTVILVSFLCIRLQFERLKRGAIDKREM